MKKQVKNDSDFGSIKFDSIKVWISKKGKLFYRLQIGKNSIFVSENLLNKIKQEAS